MTEIEEQIRLVIGNELTEALKDRLGGTEVYIPKKPNPNSLLSLALGFEAANKLCQEFGSETIYLSSKRTDIKNKIINDLDQGLSPRECALKNKVSISYIYKIQNEGS